MGCFTAHDNNGFDARPTNWTTLITVPNVFAGSNSSDAGAIFNAYRVFNTGTVEAEFRAVPESDQQTQQTFHFQLNLPGGESRPLSLAGCVNIPGGPQNMLFQVKVNSGANICIQGNAGRTGVILT